MSAVADGPWWEVQGLQSCPMQEDHECPEPESWHAIYCVDTASEAKRTLSRVIDSDDPMYDLYDDFRLAAPTIVGKRAQELAQARTMGTAPKRRRRVA